MECNFDTVQESLGKLRRGVNTTKIKSKFLSQIDAHMDDDRTKAESVLKTSKDMDEDDQEESDFGVPNRRFEELEEKVR